MESTPSSFKLTQYSHGAGCGCKISPKVLDVILHGNEAPPAPDGGAFSKPQIGALNSDSSEDTAPPLGAGGASLPCKIISNTFGDILQPHPAPWLYWVSLNDDGADSINNAILGD